MEGCNRRMNRLEPSWPLGARRICGAVKDRHMTFQLAEVARERGAATPKSKGTQSVPHELSTFALCIDARAMSSQQPVTEMAFLPFPPGTLLHDPSTPAGAIWKRVLNDVSRAQGYCGQHRGYHVEEPGQVWYLVGMLFEGARYCCSS